MKSESLFCPVAWTGKDYVSELAVQLSFAIQLDPDSCGHRKAFGANGPATSMLWFPTFHTCTHGEWLLWLWSLLNSFRLDNSVQHFAFCGSEASWLAVARISVCTNSPNLDIYNMRRSMCAARLDVTRLPGMLRWCDLRTLHLTVQPSETAWHGLTAWCNKQQILLSELSLLLDSIRPMWHDATSTLMNPLLAPQIRSTLFCNIFPVVWAVPFLAPWEAPCLEGSSPQVGWTSFCEAKVYWQSGSQAATPEKDLSKMRRSHQGHVAKWPGLMAASMLDWL